MKENKLRNKNDLNYPEWWRNGIIYQIYPRSFKDSTGNGIGDIQGIIERLDYLKKLDIDAIWLSPHYPSPMVDFGYDISNYIDVDPLFGNLDDFDELVNQAHKRKIRIIVDFVANHSSDQHEWFKESKSSKTNPKRDWYYWHDSKNGEPPNNWLCVTGGSAWGYDEITKQCYLHTFHSCQPDLNWANPEVRDAMCNVLRFWLDRGVDGFRIDMISWMSKDPKFRDDPINPNFNPKIDYYYHKHLHKFSRDGPQLYEYLELISMVLDEYEGNQVLIGEIDYYLNLEEFVEYFNHGIHLPAFFRLIYLPWNRESIQTDIDQFLINNPPYANFQIGNHDQSRVASRLGYAQARVAAMLLLTLPGTPFIYYGEEIGMKNVPIKTDEMQDPWEKTEPGKGRDPERTPMQWTSKKHAGFTEGKPWLPVSENYSELNVQQQLENPQSFLNLYRSLIRIRKNNETLTLGNYKSFKTTASQCLSYLRYKASEEWIVLLNMSDKPIKIEHNELDKTHVILSTFLDRKDELINLYIELRGNEGCLIKKD